MVSKNNKSNQLTEQVKTSFSLSEYKGIFQTAEKFLIKYMLKSIIGPTSHLIKFLCPYNEIYSNLQTYLQIDL